MHHIFIIQIQVSEHLVMFFVIYMVLFIRNKYFPFRKRISKLRKITKPPISKRRHCSISVCRTLISFRNTYLPSDHIAYNLHPCRIFCAAPCRNNGFRRKVHFIKQDHMLKSRISDRFKRGSVNLLSCMCSF